MGWESGIRKKHIPDPRVKKPGSARPPESMHDLLEDLTVGLNLVLLSDDLPCAEESPPSVALYRPAPYLPSFQ